MLTVLAVLGAVLLLSVTHAAVFCAGIGIGWHQGWAAVPEAERVQEPAPEPEPEPEPEGEAFALDAGYLIALDYCRHEALGDSTAVVS